MSSLFDDPVAAPIQPSDDGSAVQDSTISLLRRDMSLIIHPDPNLRSRSQSGSMSLNATGQCSIATPSALFDRSKATTLCLFELLPKSPVEQFIQVPFIAMYRKERHSLFIDPKPQDDKDNQKKSDPKPTLRWHKDTSIQLGRWGGDVGSYWDDGVHNGVREITLVYGNCIDSIRVTYDNNGKSFRAVKHGGMGGTKSAQIKLHFPEEILISVSGHYCPVVVGGFPVIRSLTLKSNRRRFGPFGVEEGTPFSFFTNAGHIVGFYGRSGWFVDSIGFHLSIPKPNLFQRIQMMFKGFNHHADKDDEHQKPKGSRVILGAYEYLYMFVYEILISVSGHYCPVVYGGSPDTSIQLGRWGGDVGSYWDDGVHSGVREITLVYGSCIDSIRVTYDNNGKSFRAVKHGGMGGTKSAQIKLHFPEEILISVSGHYFPVVDGGFPVIRSLTLKSNRRRFGPFGVEEGTPFSFFTNAGHIVGFYGRSGWFVDSIGFHLSIPKPNLFQRIQMMFKGFNHHADKDDEHQKPKGSKGYTWGI
ncbi:hypothetical protein L1987_45281 [Smallanthus sonchifolius]|uniref:Uncharacterized protein n=1 Tax=Smallanthus sonchifolius TaxID=185202 RepID=A0ACB9GRN4_9ASTR|nr:hypothetical protein L1987_45281 [Smallanthus sonchifolius]